MVDNIDYIDLHIHTHFSDGLLSPTEIIELAADRHLKAIALTDHDEVQGIDEAIQVGKEHGIEVVPAIEIGTSYHGKDLHILGYYINHHDPILLEHIREWRQWREERAKRIVSRLNEIGIKIPFELVKLKAGNGNIGRPHIADVLIEQGVIFSFQEAFDKYLADNKTAYIPKRKMMADEAIMLIQQIGGLAFIAHPAVNVTNEYIEELIKKGLDGIETMHPKHSPGQVNFYKGLVEKYDILESGGSDTHGPRHGTDMLGISNVPYTVLNNIKKSISHKKAVFVD